MDVVSTAPARRSRRPRSGRTRAGHTPDLSLARRARSASAAAGRDARSAVDLRPAARLRRRRVGRQRADGGAGPPRTRGDAVLRSGLGLARARGDAARRVPPRRDRALAVRGRPRGASVRRDRRATGRDRFDVVHDHCGFTALAMADRIDTPLVHTLHGPFTPDTAAFYARHAHKAALVGISRAQLASAPPGLGPIG